MEEDKLKLYYKLYDLSRQQNEAIKDEDVDKVLNLLEEKSAILEKLDGVDLKEEIRNHRNPEETLKEMQNLMEKLAELEDENVKLMEKNLKSLTKEIKSLSDGRRKVAGYSKAQANQNPSEGKVIDEKG